MKIRFSSLWACLLALCMMCSAAAGSALAETSPAALARELADEIIAGRLDPYTGTPDVQGWLDGPLAAQAASGGEWYILALSQRGDWELTACRQTLLARMETAPAASASTRLKHAFILRACGSDSPLIAQTLAESAGQQGIMSHVFALHLLNNGVATEALSAEATVATLLSLQYEDGGWALYGAASDPDVTAMVLQALAPHQADIAVQKAIDRALNRLSALQRPEGDYASFGTPNAETTAQVLLALSELGLDAMADARFIKEGHTLLDGILRYRLPDGGYAHRLGYSANEQAAAQVLLALTAYLRMQEGLPGLYLLDRRAEAEVSASAFHPAPRLLIAGGIVLVMLAAMLIMFLRGRRKPHTYVTLLLLCIALLAAVLLIHIQSADSYYSGQLPDKPDAVGSVTLSIRCDRAVGLAEGAHLPENGQLLPPTAMPIRPGDTVFTLLTEAAQAFGIHLESSGSAGMRYVQGMGNLYEFGCGDLSGWLYAVNGATPSVGCDQYLPGDGDVIEWAYSLDMGGDLGWR